MNSNNELQEVLLQAMEIIANKAVEDNNKDKDITLWTCTITDDSNRKSGEYKVTDENVTFYAYSAYTDYKKDDHVAVVIPKGDFNNTKYIVQKVAADGTQLPYASPLDNYIEMTDDLIGDFGVRNYTVNDNGKEYEIARIDLDNAYSATTTQGVSLYNALIFKCVFQTNLSSYKGVKGNYGIKIILDYLNELGYPLQETLTFDSSEFLGNIYNFMVPSIQTKGFALTKSEVLQRITVRYYQNLEMPQSKKAKTTSSFTPPLIELEDLHIYFGSDISKVENQTLELYSLDGLTYYGDKTQADNEKRIGLMWYNKNEEGFKGFSDGIYDVAYDEEAYLNAKQEKAAQDIEFKKENAPKTAAGIAAAAYLTSFEEDTKTILANIDKIISTVSDMNIEMHGIFSKISEEVKDRVDKISNKVKSDGEGYLANLHKKFEEDVKSFVSKYRKALTTTEEIEDIFPFDELDELDSILSADESFEYLLGKSVLDTIKTNYGGYFGVFESYDSRIKKIRASIHGLREKINGEQTPFKDSFKIRNTDQNKYEPFKETGFENRYCVYWYEYEQGYESTNEYDKQIAGSNWKKLSEQNGFWNPGVGKSVSGIVYNQEFKKGIFTYSISPAAKDKKLMAVLFYNHNQYKSKPLSFSRIASDGTIIDDNGVFEIQHGDGSTAVYSNYGEDSYLINSSDARKERILVPQFISTLGKSLKDFIGGQIYWYLPQDITMLKYDEKNELIQTYAVSKDLSSMDPKHYRQGYYCFTKSIQNAVDEDGSEIPITNRDLGFSYLINNCYSSTYTNNTIYCKIVKGSWEYETYMPFSFSSYGTNGTDYTLAFQIPPGGRSAVTANDPMVLHIKLFDYNKKEAPLYLPKDKLPEGKMPEIPENLYGYELEATFLSGVDSNPECTLEQEGTYVKATIKKSEIPRYGILRVSANIQDKARNTAGLKLVNFYSVPYSNPIETGGKDFIEGATQIIYSSFGNDPKYYKDLYKLYSGADAQEQTSVKWSILSGTQNDGFPKIDETNKLIVRDSFTEDVRGTIPVAIATDKDDANKIYWYQPIFVSQNQYEFKLLNEWNGKMQINEKEGYILSNMLVAGKKADNKFTGVVMGDMGTLNKFETGLFGIHEGISSFGFKTDGTAYLGKSGSGRIDFDGNKGTITSAGYDLIKEENNVKTDIGSGIFLDLDAPIFSIKKDGTKVMLVDYRPVGSGENEIEKKQFYLQTKDFILPDPNATDEEKKNGKGFKIDLEEGTIQAYSGLTIKTSEFDLSSSEGNFALQMSKDNFLLQADKEHYISSSSKGIQWGKYFGVNENSFWLGNTDGTYIQGKEEKITFNFKNGETLTFSSDNGLQNTGTISISSSEQILKSKDFDDAAKKGMKIDLQDGSITAYTKLTIKTSNFDLSSTKESGFQLLLTDSDFLLKADSNHFISKDPNDGIMWGDLFKVNSAGFQIGSNELDKETGTYTSCFISGNKDKIAFNFSDGKYVTFSSGNDKTLSGITTADGNVTVREGQQILKNSTYKGPYTDDEGKYHEGTGMCIDLSGGNIYAYEGLHIITDDFQLGTHDQKSGLTLTKQYFKAFANENNYIEVMGGSSPKVVLFSQNVNLKANDNNYLKIENKGMEIKSQNFTLSAGEDYEITKEHIYWGSFFKVDENSFQLGGSGTTTTGTYNSSFISGNAATGISFNFANGTYLTFDSADGLFTEENNGNNGVIKITQGTQLFKSSDFYDPSEVETPEVNEDGSFRKASGMCIDLFNGKIKAFDGLTIVTDDFNLGDTLTGNTFIKLKPYLFQAQADVDNYLKINSEGVEIQTNNFNLVTSDNALEIRSNPSGTQNYLNIGNGALILDLNQNLSLKPHDFELNTADSNLYISSSKESIRLGDMMFISENNYLFRTNDYNETEKTGAQLGLTGSFCGIKTFNNFTIESQQDDNYIFMSSVAKKMQFQSWGGTDRIIEVNALMSLGQRFIVDDIGAIHVMAAKGIGEGPFLIVQDIDDWERDELTIRVDNTNFGGDGRVCFSTERFYVKDYLKSENIYTKRITMPSHEAETKILFDNSISVPSVTTSHITTSSITTSNLNNFVIDDNNRIQAYDTNLTLMQIKDNSVQGTISLMENGDIYFSCPINGVSRSVYLSEILQAMGKV